MCIHILILAKHCMLQCVVTQSAIVQCNNLTVYIGIIDNVSSQELSGELAITQQCQRCVLSFLVNTCVLGLSHTVNHHQQPRNYHWVYHCYCRNYCTESDNIRAFVTCRCFWHASSLSFLSTFLSTSRGTVPIILVKRAGQGDDFARVALIKYWRSWVAEAAIQAGVGHVCTSDSI